MAASENFTKPNWNNPIDTDIDQMRDNFNFLLTVIAAGAEVIPGWQTNVDISTNNNYAEPDSLVFSKGTRQIEVKIVWA